MRKTSAAQYARLRANQDAVLKDTGLILTYAQQIGADRRQEPGTFTAQAAIPMGYRPRSPKEVHDDQEVAIILGRVRLPVGTAVTSKDRIRITHINGQALATAIDFAIYGPPMARPTVVICNLTKITDGSTGS